MSDDIEPEAVANKSEFKRVVSRTEFYSSGWYSYFGELPTIFNHEIVAYKSMANFRHDILYGCPKEEIWGWKPNKLMCYIKNGLDMNVLANQNFSSIEYMKFYMQIGYSLVGFYDVFGDEASEYQDLVSQAIKIDDESYESVIDHMRRVHAGKVLGL